MKKFFLIAAAAAMVLSSCSKNEVSENNSESNLIGFSSYTGRSATKADGSFVPKGTTMLPTNSQFGIFCYHTGSTAFAGTSEIANFMLNQAVKYEGAQTSADKGDNTKYTYSPSRYWPSDGANNLLSFIAYYPFVASNATNTEGLISKPVNTTAGLGEYTFVVPSIDNPLTAVGSAAKRHIDFMLSDVVADQTYTTNSSHNGAVDLQFHHMLSQINFQAKTDKDYNNGTTEKTVIKITGLTLTNVMSKGTLSAATTSDGCTWGTTANTPSTFNVPISTTEEYVTLGTDPKDFTSNRETANSATLLMIPQTIPTDTGAAKLTVTYTYQTDGMETITNTKTVDLSVSGGITAWEKNKSYTYIISIALNKITFTATVNDWVDVTPAQDI